MLSEKAKLDLLEPQEKSLKSVFGDLWTV